MDTQIAHSERSARVAEPVLESNKSGITGTSVMEKDQYKHGSVWELPARTSGQDSTTASDTPPKQLRAINSVKAAHSGCRTAQQTLPFGEACIDLPSPRKTEGPETQKSGMATSNVQLPATSNATLQAVEAV